MKQRFFKSRYFHLILFILTLITTTIAGAEFVTGKSFFDGEPRLTFSELYKGAYYSIPFLLILSFHEFGHYFMAKYHKIKTSLPYYIPFYLGFILPFSIGTMGAVIRIRSIINSRKIFFDIGIAGPLAGFIVAIGVLWYGFAQLPFKEYILKIHPDYKQYGAEFEKYVYDPKVLRKNDSLEFIKRQRADSIKYESKRQKNDTTTWKGKAFDSEGVMLISLGDNFIFAFFKKYVAASHLLPHQYEMMHYPFILVGYLALFLTALNLIPIGQLDGGHILYGLIGNKRHRIVSAVLLVAFVFYGGIGFVTLKQILKEPSDILNALLYLGFLYLILSKVTSEARNNLLIAVSIFTGQFVISYFYPDMMGGQFWLFWSFLISRVLGLYHPQTLYDEPLDTKRKVLGWITLVIFILIFSPEPFIIELISY